MIWFQLGTLWDAGPEITNGLGAFLYAAASEPGSGPALSREVASAEYTKQLPAEIVAVTAFARRALVSVAAHHYYPSAFGKTISNEVTTIEWPMCLLKNCSS